MQFYNSWENLNWLYHTAEHFFKRKQIKATLNQDGTIVTCGP